MSYEFITVEKQDHLTIVTMNRPEAMNSLHPPACAEMNEVFNDFAVDARLGWPWSPGRGRGPFARAMI